MTAESPSGHSSEMLGGREDGVIKGGGREPEGPRSPLTAPGRSQSFCQFGVTERLPLAGSALSYVPRLQARTEPSPALTGLLPSRQRA